MTTRKRRARRDPSATAVRRLAAVLLLGDPVERRLSFVMLDELVATFAAATEPSEVLRWNRALEAARHYTIEVRRLGPHRRPWDDEP